MSEKKIASIQYFLIIGASSGLGHAVAMQLLKEGHHVFLVARRENILFELFQNHSKQVQYLAGDVCDEEFIKQLDLHLPDCLTGAFINAGGPPAKTMLETTLQDWDLAYNQLIRWKIQLTQILIPKLLKNQYGRIVYSESTSINRPVKNLVLSNSLRMSIIGFIKTLVLEHDKSGITFNILAPGYHDTSALERLYKKLSVQDEITLDEAKIKLTSSIPAGEIGSVDDYASLASWLLSKNSSFVTGQVFTIDGGASI
jgi:3-oxoacyl-[acyl-carrier protein] reductase